MKTGAQVSVVVPAFNVAKTVGETLESLVAQTFEAWEAIVVDDGSRDDTANIVAGFVKEDDRFRLLSQANQGASAARNTAIAQANAGWLLFLDADDWLLPHHLQRMVGKLEADPALDAVHCGWTRVSPAGVIGPAKYAPDVCDMFDLFAQRCVFQPHACLVRRSLVNAVGGFETSLRSCQDWDFWQRIARTGARFGAVREPLCRYRTRPGSISLNGAQLMDDGMRVITQGHSADDRVPHPAHPDGRSTELLASARIHFACWPAGLVLGLGQDARPLLRALHEDREPHLSPAHVAAFIFEAALLSGGRAEGDWLQLWPQVEENVVAFLEDLERQTGAPDLARRALKRLEISIAEVPQDRPFTIGRTRSIELEVTSPLPECIQLAGAERLHCHLLLEGDPLGSIVVPAAAHVVDRPAIVQAIAHHYAWPILGRFFRHTLYPQLELRQDFHGRSLWRGDVCLMDDLPRHGDVPWSQVHDDVGWCLFLQEIWSRPNWPAERFYEDDFVEPPAEQRRHTATTLAVSLHEPLPDVSATAAELNVSLQIGRVSLGPVTLPVHDGYVAAQRLRAALTSFAAFDLCRAVVREVLVGTSLSGDKTILQRLALYRTLPSAPIEGQEPLQ